MRLVRARFYNPKSHGRVGGPRPGGIGCAIRGAVMRHAAMEESDDLPKTDVAKPSLPTASPRCGSARTTCGRRRIRSFAFSPGGRLVAAGRPPCPESAGHDLRRADRPAGQAARRTGESGGLGRDGRVLARRHETALGGNVGEVALWDLSADRLLFRQKLHRSNVMDVKFSPDGRLFASGGRGRGYPPPDVSRSPRKSCEISRRGRWAAPGLHTRRHEAGRGGPVQHDDLESGA